ncbi:hypothetical protein BS50DRAFT_506351 [Corynespora cassiicola Philippines]|uniref:C2H2-type domain-containing protein n=1 Tax=Corynespora cassiicola Philippines TaxID=1448308 RepID=A0A2T2N4T4_CORCC|nr:hypothetical protein BS50DRAFT_506351 [Corynespora cassiicola Philippines]
MAASARAITPSADPFNRPSTPGSAMRNSNSGATFGTHLTKSPRALSPQPLTGATALADERRLREHDAAHGTSPNPNVAAVQSLIGASNHAAMSRPKDAPPEPAQMSAPLEKVAKSLVIPEHGNGEAMQTSPVSLSSFGSADSTTAPTATATDATAGPMNISGQEGAPPPQPPQHQQQQQQQQQQPQPQPQQHHHQPIAPNPGDVPSNRAFTFPGPLPPEVHDPRAPTRQMSLPGYPQNSPKSPSAKRHKCPYCSTDFTRHHNLKSHLLTHSQEKPYECPTCQARFRRLHDLKRHTKLHTGERPHTCPKCGRRFARGDALARHNKGQGGCAGRRSSFGIDDPDAGDVKGEDAMDGVLYHQERDGEGDDDDENGRRISEPARKRQNTGNSTQAPSSISSLHYNSNQPNVFSQGGMTESPKPISPGQQEHHRLGAHEGSIPGPRSPNMSQQMHQQNFARGAGRGSSPMGLAPPHPSSGPHLPSLPGLNPMIPKQGSQGGKAGAPNAMQHQQMAAPGTASQPGSMSSHGASSGGSMREVMGNQGIDMWSYVRDMEARMARMEKEHENKMSSLQDEVTTLRAQLAQQHAQSTSQQQGQ